MTKRYNSVFSGSFLEIRVSTGQFSVNCGPLCLQIFLFVFGITAVAGKKIYRMALIVNYIGNFGVYLEGASYLQL